MSVETNQGHFTSASIRFITTFIVILMSLRTNLAQISTTILLYLYTVTNHNNNNIIPCKPNTAIQEFLAILLHTHNHNFNRNSPVGVMSSHYVGQCLLCACVFVYIHSQTHTQYLHRFVDRYYHMHNCKKEGRRVGREEETERVI